MPSAAGERAPRVGVLAVQGDWRLHARALERLGATVVRVTRAADLDGLDALVLPGGESSAMLRLIAAGDLRRPLERFVAERPVLGTCAGLILLARSADRLALPTFGVLDVDVRRNAYGRQLDSFSDDVVAPAVGGRFPGVFIRAPRIARHGRGVEVIATHGGEPVGVRAGRVVALTFHPELTDDLRLHRWFLEHVATGPALESTARRRTARPAPRTRNGRRAA